MDSCEALRSIRYDLLEYIQQRIPLLFDDARQIPLSFSFGNATKVVRTVLGRFRLRRYHPPNAYLVQTAGDDVYLVYRDHCGPGETCHAPKMDWVLSFRILRDHELMALYREERKMLLNMHLKRVVDFGKHNYTLLSKHLPKGYRVTLKKQEYGDEDEYRRLERRLDADCLTMDEVVHFQKLLDRRVQRLLNMAPEEIFLAGDAGPANPPTETASFFQECSRCGEQVLENRIIAYQGAVYCMPCFQRMQTHSPLMGLQ